MQVCHSILSSSPQDSYITKNFIFLKIKTILDGKRIYIISKKEKFEKIKDRAKNFYEVEYYFSNNTENNIVCKELTYKETPKRFIFDKKEFLSEFYNNLHHYDIKMCRKTFSDFYLEHFKFDYIIDNNGSLEEYAIKISKLIDELDKNQ